MDSNSQEELEGRPAGRPTHAVGQQPEGVLLLSARDKRTWEWMIAQVGEEAVLCACAQLKGKRLPYVSNLAKILGLRPPSNLELASESDVKRHIAILKALLTGNNHL